MSHGHVFFLGGNGYYIEVSFESLAMARGSAPTCIAKSGAPSWLIIAAFVIVALLAATLVYQYALRPMAAARRAEGFAAASEKRQLVYLHMNGCGWCQRFTPVWDAFVVENGEALKAAGVTPLKLERKEAGAAAFADSVEGYPTVLLVAQGGGTTKFEGERTNEGLKAFVGI